MAERIIIRGDSYALRRPLYRIELLTQDGLPFDLTGCTVRTTYKPEATSPQEDPNDISAAIQHDIEIGGDGEPEREAGLYLVGDAEEGVIEERLTASESRSLPLDTSLYSDIELTDANGEKFTWIMTDTLRAVDAYTNRE